MPKILSLDFELMGVFDKSFVDSWICEAAGGYPDDPANGEAPKTILGQSNPLKHTADLLTSKLAAQNGLTDNPLVKANRDATRSWIQAVSGCTQQDQCGDTTWLGQNFRVHDWQFIKSLGPWTAQERPAIIDTLELSLLLHPEAKDVSLRKDYKGAGYAVSVGTGSSQVDVAAQAKSENKPEKDAENAYNRACKKSQFVVGEQPDGGLLVLIKSHPLKDLLDLILLRDAPKNDWLRKDWEAVCAWPEAAAANAATCRETIEEIKKRLGLPNCSTTQANRAATLSDFQKKFCAYLHEDPFACAYFVCWLDKAKAPGQRFAPHPWIAENYSAVLHLIRLYFADDTKAPPASSPISQQKTEAPRPGLLGWLDLFSTKAKDGKWTLKGRYVEIPAALDGDEKPICPKFPGTHLEGSPEADGRCLEALECHRDTPCNFHGIHQADVIGRILGFDSAVASERSSPDKTEFSPAGIYVAPTGFGKSLCYQLPAFIMARAWKALTIVISPLQALQADQVRGMANANPEAIRVINEESYNGRTAPSQSKDKDKIFTVAFYNSTLNASERTLIRQAVTSGECDLIFIAPEQLLNPGVIKMLACRDIGLVALDEAHCLSAWGQSFRPEYMYIAKWLDGYCQDRLARFQHGLGRKKKVEAENLVAEANGTNGDPDWRTDVSHLAWSSYAPVKKAGAYAPYPRAALFTATLEPESTRQLQGLFLPGATDAADHTIGGYAPRNEIDIEIYPGALRPFQPLGPAENEAATVTNQKEIGVLYAAAVQKQRAKYARRLGVLSEFLLEKFPGTPKRLYELPILIYSSTVKQTELLFGKPATMSEPWGQEPDCHQLPFGLSAVVSSSGPHWPLISYDGTQPILRIELPAQGTTVAQATLDKLQGHKDVLRSQEPDGNWSERGRVLLLPTTAEAIKTIYKTDGRGKHWKYLDENHYPYCEVYPWVLSPSFFADADPDKRSAHLTGLLAGLAADDTFYGKPFSLCPADDKGERKPTSPPAFSFLSNQSSIHLDETAFTEGRVAIYHGQMPVGDRRVVMDAFTQGGAGKPNLILCTNAFGMGVDRGDICSVILLGMPASLNDLLQQAGRAKRDRKKMQATIIGKDDGGDVSARAIVLTDTTADAQLHQFMLMQSRIRADYLDRVWQSIQKTHQRMKTFVEKVCSGKATQSTTDRFPLNPIENCFALDKITVTLADLRQEWSKIDPTTDLLAHRNRALEARYGLHDLDAWDEEMDQRLRQCFYWLERLGAIERLPNCPRVASYEVTDCGRRDTRAEVEADLALLFGDHDGKGAWCPKFTLPENTLKEWREVSANPKNRDAFFNADSSEREPIMREWTKFLHDKLAALLGHEAHPSPCTCPDPAQCTVGMSNLPDCLPLQSRALRYLLHPLLIQKLKQKSEPTEWNILYLYQQAQDVLTFIERNEGKTPIEADFGTYQNAPKLFNLLRRLGWVKDTSKIMLVVSDPNAVKTWITKVCDEAAKFDPSDPNKTNDLLRKGVDDISGECLTGFLTLTGAIHGLTDQGYAQLAAKDPKHINSIKNLHDPLIECIDLSKTIPTVLEVCLKAASSSIKNSVDALRKHDPLFRYDAVGLVTAFIGWLQHWQRENVMIQEGNGLLTQAYTLRIKTVTFNAVNADIVEDLPDHEELKQKRFPYNTSEEQISKICSELQSIKVFLCKITSNKKQPKDLCDLVKSKWEEDYGVKDDQIPKPPGNESVHACEAYNLQSLFQETLNNLAETHNSQNPPPTAQLTAPKLQNFPAYKRKASKASILLDDTAEYARAQIEFLTRHYIPGKALTDHQEKPPADLQQLPKAEDSVKKLRADITAEYYNPAKRVIRDLMAGHHRKEWILQEVHGPDGALVLPKPSQQQIAFIKDNDAFSFLQAGPGTGKTATLIRKLMWLVFIEGVPAEKIAFIAFNVAVAKSIKRKVRATAQALGLPDLNQVFIGTCHSYMRKMLYLDAKIINGKTAEDTTSELLKKMSEAITKAPNVLKISIPTLENPTATYYIGAMGRAACDKVFIAPKDNNNELTIAPQDAYLHNENSKNSEKVFLNYPNNSTDKPSWSALAVAAAIRATCAGNDTFVNHTHGNYEVIKTPLGFNFTHTHLLIDEVQDIADTDTKKKSPGVGIFLRKLVHWGREYDGGLKTVIAVGDPDQGIYGYAGCDGDFLQDFKKLAECLDCTKKAQSDKSKKTAESCFDVNFESFVNPPKKK